MKSALNLISALDEQTIRDVHAGEVSRSVLSHTAEQEGFPKSAGEYAHRLIRAHENLEAFIAFYCDGVSHAMTGDEAPEIDGNRADVTVRYPHGRPVRGLDRLLRDHQEDPNEWEVESFTANEWPTTMADDSGEGDVIYVNNFQAKARLSKKTREPQYEPIQPVEVSASAPDVPDRSIGESPKPPGWRTALIWSDSHYSYRREESTGNLYPTHDRHSIDLIKQVAALAEIDEIDLIGDALDCPAISDYLSKPQLQRTLQPALLELDYDLAQIRELAQPDTTRYVEGNHEERLREMLLSEAKEIYQLRSVEAVKQNEPAQASIPGLMQTHDKGIEWVGDYPDEGIRLNEGLSLAHDWGSLGSKSGHTVYKVLRDQKGEVSRIQGHGHRHEQAWFTNWEGQNAKEYMGMMLGCTSRLDGVVEGVKARQNWQQSFTLVHYDPDGWLHTVEPIKVYNSRRGDAHRECYFRGRQLRSREPDLEELSRQTNWRFTHAGVAA